jgi:hypothetical protein
MILRMPELGRLALFAGWLLAGAASCAPPAPPSPAFDGMYVGQDSLVRGGGFLCGLPTRELSITIRNGQFDYPFQVAPPRTAPLPAQIAADGTVTGQLEYGTTEYTSWRGYLTAVAILSGRVTGDILEATISDLRCTRRLVARRT